MSDTELIERLADDDHWAKEALYRRYVRLVWGTALRLMGNSADAEDVVQDAFAEALRDLPKLSKVENLQGWMRELTVHQAHRRFRRRSLLRRLGLDRSADDACLSALVHPSASPETYAELLRVDRALGAVSADERFVWILRHVEGLSLGEVAGACSCSLATVKRRLARANACVERHRASEAG